MANRLPVTFGSAAGLVVAGIGMLTQATPATCALRAAAAYSVFAAFGIVLRYLLAIAAESAQSHAQLSVARKGGAADLENIAPGTTVEELLAQSEGRA